MKRTPILLPSELRERADRLARQLGVSFGELVRRALARMIEAPMDPPAGDAFLSDDAVYSGDAPVGVSVHHDIYLCVDEP